MEFEQAKSFLSQQMDGQSIYDHLTDIIKKILDDKPDNALDMFENISLQVKEARGSESNDISFPLVPNNQNERLELMESVTKVLEFYGKKKPKPPKKDDDEDGADEEEDAEENDEENALDVTKVSNILENVMLLEWAGVKFSDKNEMYQLQEALIKFAKVKGEVIEKSRFFGKINAIYSDYWVLECKMTEYPEPNPQAPEKQEAPGVGINEYVYFVTSDLIEGNWVQLPDANPIQVKQSRNVYRLFTGNLDAKVSGQAFFDGVERDLLRCQIARIVSSCTLAPASWYNPPEEEDEENPLLIELNEEFEGIEEANQLESWVHTRGSLRLEGRYVKFKSGNEDEEEDGDEEKDDDADAEKKAPLPEDLEEQVPILRSVAEDVSKALKPIFARKPRKNPSSGDEDGGDGDAEEEEDADEDGADGALNVWHVRNFNSASCFSVVSLNNKLWPGAKCLHLKNSKRFFNIYIGNGMKYSANYYTPLPPELIVAPFKEMIPVEAEENGDEAGDDTQEQENGADGDETGDANEQEKKESGPKMVSIFDTIQSEVPKPPTPPPEADDAEKDENEEA